jgi:hypothetical protein
MSSSSRLTTHRRPGQSSGGQFRRHRRGCRTAWHRRRQPVPGSSPRSVDPRHPVHSRVERPSALLAVDLVVESPVEAGALLVSIHQVIELKGLKSVPTRALSFPASQRHRRGQTMSPPLAPPRLICPRCDRPWSYSTEQWDYFDCGNHCGTFQYRQRTRRLRPAVGLPRHLQPGVSRSSE